METSTSGEIQLLRYEFGHLWRAPNGSNAKPFQGMALAIYTDMLSSEEKNDVTFELLNLFL